MSVAKVSIDRHQKLFSSLWWLRNRQKLLGSTSATEFPVILRKMPVIALFIKAQMDGIGKIVPIPNTQWCLDLKNTLGEEYRKEIYIDSTEVQEIEGGGTDEVHFALKWEGSKKQATLSVVEAGGDIQEAYTSEDVGQWVPVVAFDCRGLEPCTWHPQKNFVGEGTSGFLMDDIDFSEGDYCGFDEDEGCPTEISELEWKFEVLPDDKKGKKKKK